MKGKTDIAILLGIIKTWHEQHNENTKRRSFVMNDSFIKLFQNNQPIGISGDLRKKTMVLFIALLAIFAIYFRNTRYFTEPRFWAEEGTLHFAYSFNNAWYQALFQPQVGYLNFWPNLATLLATLPPLPAAPLITTFMALIVQIVPVLIILWSNSPLWESWYRKLLGIAILLFVPLTNEGWLNTINSYTYFAVITFLILLDQPPQSPVRRWLYRILLFLGGLSGTLSCFLIPLFIFKAYDEKNKERLIQTLLLIACAFIQVFLIVSYKSTANFGQRFHLIGMATFGITMWTQGIGFFVLGLHQADEWARTLFAMATHNLGSFQMWGRILLICGLTLLLLLSSNLPLKLRVLFLSGYGVLMLLPMMFSVIQDKYALIDTGLHQRIFFAPNILLGWMLLFGIRFSKIKLISFANLTSLFCALVLGAALFWGIKNYPEIWFVSEYWPDWKTEVATWENNPNYALRIQPEGWVVQLHRRP